MLHKVGPSFKIRAGLGYVTWPIYYSPLNPQSDGKSKSLSRFFDTWPVAVLKTRLICLVLLITNLLVKPGKCIQAPFVTFCRRSEHHF